MAIIEDYKITGRFMSGIILKALEVTDTKGKKQLVSMDNVFKLIKLGKVQGCSLVGTGDKMYIYCEEFKLHQLPIVSNVESEKQLSIKHRLIKDTKLIGYVALDNEGKEYNLSSEKVWDMAIQGYFNNIKASACGNKKVLNGVGISLLDIDILKV